jgi:hypothetical protein
MTPQSTNPELEKQLFDITGSDIGGTMFDDILALLEKEALKARIDELTLPYAALGAGKTSEAYEYLKSRRADLEKQLGGDK